MGLAAADNAHTMLVTIETVALSGQPVPWAGPGVVFESFPESAINSSGEVAFVASDSDGVRAVVVGRQSLAPSALSGDPAPGGTFTRFFSPGITSTGDTTFGALTSGAAGIWRTVDGAVQLVAGAGNPAPGTEADTFFTGIPSGFATNQQGQIALAATVTGPTVTIYNNRGVWGPTPSSDFDLLARDGSAAPGTPTGVLFNAFGTAVVNDSGTVAFKGTLRGTGPSLYSITSFNNEGIFATDASGVVSLLAREGEAAPGTTSTYYTLRDPVVDGMGTTYFISGLAYVPAGENGGIWRSGPAGPELLLREGSQAPGAAPGQVFSSFANLFVNERGDLAFRSFLFGPGVTNDNKEGIWRSDGSGGFDLLARAGDPVPGLPGATFSQFNGELGLSDRGSFVFGSSFVGDSNGVGVFLATADGDLELLFRDGDRIEVAPGDLRTLRTWSLTSDFYSSGHSGLSPQDEFAFTGYFTDGSTGVFVGSVPREPTVFFSQNGAGGSLSNIRTVNGAGGASPIVVTNLASPYGVALDLRRGKIYWNDAGSDSIHRASLDGTSIEDLITAGLNDPHDIVLDLQAGEMYFADRANNAIKRASLDGSNVEVVIAASLPQELALDVINQQIYWSETASGRIKRSNLDGTAVETLVDLGSGNSITGVALDPNDWKLYFANRGQQKIQRVDLDGANLEDVVTLANSPLTLALDLRYGYVYWSFFDSIQRVRFDLAGGIETLISGLPGSELLNGVNGIVLDLTECDDGYDNDGDGLMDAGGDLADVGCRDAAWYTESPDCQDGINNDPDQDAFIDFDGGLSALGYVATDPDLQCTDRPWGDEQRRRCGLGLELAFVLPPLMWLQRRRRRA